MGSRLVGITFPIGGALLLVLLLLYACGDELTLEASDGGAEDGSVPDGGVEIGDADALDGRCASDAGPKMVPVGLFCIDATEVTNGQYAAFLSANDGGVVTDAGRDRLLPKSGCAWKDWFQPAVWPVAPGTENLPVGEVDWCDAYAFCKWAGKRLCGKIVGGPIRLEATDGGQDQWFTACSAGGARNFPYGNTYSGSACNTDDPSGSLVPAGSKPECEGSAPGLFDMSGNAAEWADACRPSDAGSTEDQCATRGGSFRLEPPRTACGYVQTERRGGRGFGTSFRCCGPATP